MFGFAYTNAHTLSAIKMLHQQHLAYLFHSHQNVEHHMPPRSQGICSGESEMGTFTYKKNMLHSNLRMTQLSFIQHQTILKH